MELMSRHKYGVRPPKADDPSAVAFDTLNRTLGCAAVTVDLLEVKHSSPVTLSLSPCGGASRGAAFIMYNSARIEHLVDVYEQRLSQGDYEQPTAEADWSLLKEEVMVLRCHYYNLQLLNPSNP